MDTERQQTTFLRVEASGPWRTSAQHQQQYHTTYYLRSWALEYRKACNAAHCTGEWKNSRHNRYGGVAARTRVRDSSTRYIVMFREPLTRIEERVIDEDHISSTKAE